MALEMVKSLDRIFWNDADFEHEYGLWRIVKVDVPSANDSISKKYPESCGTVLSLNAWQYL
jgi:hypothetical protein